MSDVVVIKVNSQQEAMEYLPDFDGRLQIFLNISNDSIYTKRLNVETDGAEIFIEYVQRNDGADVPVSDKITHTDGSDNTAATNCL